jgi:DNA-binding FrmR family transcriptional regulator
MSRTHNRQPMVNRMARIEGHVHAVREMLVSDRDCPEILIQLAAIRSALDGVARLVFEDHMDSCIVDAVETGNAEAKIADIKTAFARYFI